MTFSEIVQDVADRCGLTSADALDRIGQRVNRRYRRVLTDVGMININRVSATVAVVTGTRLQTITGIQRVVTVSDATEGTRPALREITYEEMLTRVPSDGAPTSYAVKRVGAAGTTLIFDTTFAAARNLEVSGDDIATTLSGSMIPAFPETYHDILFYGAVADELKKKEKLQLAKDAELDYERMLSQLRLYLAVSINKDIQQGKMNVAENPNLLGGALADGAGAGGPVADTGGSCCYVIDVTDADYGASGNGTTDDSTAIEAAIAEAAIFAAANETVTIFFPPGTYRLTRQIAMAGTSNVRFVGAGRGVSILQWDDGAYRGLYIDSSVAPFSTTLTSNASIGDRTIAVTDSTDFTVGDWVFLDDAGTRNGTLVTRVVAKAAGSLTLEDACPMNLLVADTATAYGYTSTTFPANITIRDLTFRCADSSPASMLTLLLLSRCAFFEVRDCAFSGSTGPLITTRSCYNGRFEGNVLENAVTVAGAGIELQTSSGTLLKGNAVSFCPFGLTTSASPYTRIVGNRVSGRVRSIALGRGIKLQDQSNFSVVEGNTCSDMNLYGVYLQDSAHCVISGNALTFAGGDNSDDGEHGIQSGGFEAALCHHNTMVGNSIRGCSGYGIAVYPTTAAAVSLYNIVALNNISYCKQGAILIGWGKFCTVHGNVVSANATTYIGGAIRVTFDAAYCTISDNIITSETGAALVGINSAGGTGYCRISANVLESGLTTSYDALDITDDTLITAGTLAVVNPRRIPKPEAFTTNVGTDADLLEKTLVTFTIPAGVMDTDLSSNFSLWASFTVVAGGGNMYIKVDGVTVKTVTAAQITVNGNVEVHMKGVRESATILKGSSQVAQYGATSAVITGGGWSASYVAANAATITITAQNDSVAAANRIQFNKGCISFTGTPADAFV